MTIAGCCPKHGFFKGESCRLCEVVAEVVYIKKFGVTSEMKNKGFKYHAEYFPDESRIYDKLYNRRKQEKPVDGKCFQEAGKAIEELRIKRGKLI